MFGITFGEGAYAGELPPWRGIVEATGVVNAESLDQPVGGSTVIGASNVSAPGDVAGAAAGVASGASDFSAAVAMVPKTVSLIEGSGSLDGDAPVAAPTVSLMVATGAVSQRASLDVDNVAIGVGAGDVSQDGEIVVVGGSIAMGTSVVRAAADFDVTTSSIELPPLFKPTAPELQPLQESHEADELERELKELFILMFETLIRPDERFVNTLGMPQHGPRELIESSLANDGLSIYRGADAASGAGAYLLRAWRSMNPKRGTHLLETYLQLLWPNVWTAEQMWQNKDPLVDYTEGLVAEADIPPGDEDEYFLTSRVNVSLPARVSNGGDLAAIQSGLRASVPARVVMNLAIVSEESFGIGIANAYYTGLVAQSYEGTIA